MISRYQFGRGMRAAAAVFSKDGRSTYFGWSKSAARKRFFSRMVPATWCSGLASEATTPNYKKAKLSASVTIRTNI